jgi:hypothetical protein
MLLPGAPRREDITMAASHPFLTRSMLLLLCTVLLAAAPAHAFTANSLDMSIDESGDATAVFRFTLEGLIENAIPQSMLEEQLVNGLASGSEPPTLVSMDRSSATLLIKKFANTYDVPTGTEYQTSAMDFRKAEIALQNSAVSSVITADFSPSTATMTFPDGYSRTFADVESLPSMTHIVIDPAKASAAAAVAEATPDPSKGSINITATPDSSEVWIDSEFLGYTPSEFPGIAPGRHVLMVKKAGYSPITKDIDIPTGRSLRVSVYLMEVPVTTKASSPPSGCLAAAAGLALAACLFLLKRD